MDPYIRFEAIVTRLFLALGFEVQSSVVYERGGPGGAGKRSEVDLVLAKDGVRSVVEIKMYRSRTPRISDLDRAARRVVDARYATRADNAFLVINLRRDRLPDRGFLPPGVTLVGLDDLIAMADGNTEVLSELADVTRELQSGLADFDADIDLSPASDPVTADFFQRPSDRKSSSAPLPQTGAALVDDLQAIAPGKGVEQTLPSGMRGVNWSLFEKIAQKSLEYIFEHELSGWRAQAQVGGEGGRLDVMAKVTGDDVFSRTLIEDFRTRYLLFEFENYTDPIDVNLIHITEKYLFPTALRSTVVFVSPKGLSDAAGEATRGALRDAGKLMLDLPVKALVEMLYEKDGGTGGGGRMEALLDEFLLSLGR